MTAVCEDDVGRALRESEARWKALFDNAPDQIFGLDKNGIIRFVNRVVSPLTLEEVRGTHWLAWVTADERDRLQEAFDRVVKTAEPIAYELVARGADGAMAWYSSHLGPVVENGVVTGVVLIARDQTEQKAAEAQLFAADRMISMGSLAAGVAHEINNPLAALIVNVDVAGRVVSRLPSESKAVLETLLSDVREAASRVRNIVRDLKLLARPDEETRAVDLATVIDWSIRMAWFEVRHKATLVREYAHLPPALANDGRLGQVFVNLLVNAAQSIPSGHPDQHRITVRGRSDDRFVYVDVVDTGIGMSEALLSKLFSPFISTKPRGTGLGLSISQRIVASFGGTISVESSEGRGSTFTVALPRAGGAAVAAAPSTATPATPMPACARGRVLVIDDDPMIGLAIQRALEGAHDATVATSGEAGLARLTGDERFDVVLCDLMMPSVSGMDVYREVSKQKPEVARDMIFMTGGVFSDNARAFLDSVPNRCLEKPFEAESIARLVNWRVAAQRR